MAGVLVGAFAYHPQSELVGVSMAPDFWAARVRCDVSALRGRPGRPAEPAERLPDAPPELGGPGVFGRLGGAKAPGEDGLGLVSVGVRQGLRGGVRLVRRFVRRAHRLARARRGGRRRRVNAP